MRALILIECADDGFVQVTVAHDGTEGLVSMTVPMEEVPPGSGKGAGTDAVRQVVKLLKRHGFVVLDSAEYGP